LEAVKHFKTRLIYASSCEVYGAPLNNKPIKEDAELRPHSPYAVSKAAADRLCFSYFITYGIDVVIVRPFNVFGPFQKKGSGGAVIPIFVDLAIKGKPLTIYGQGNQKRDYMYIDDLVKAYDLVYNHKELTGQVINFGTGKETKIIDIAKYIAKKFHVEIIHKEARPGEVSHFRADITKAKRLGFKPSVDIWSGINKYIEWYKKQV
jgi:dTDP-glucose 4,6-dehydratase